MFFYGLVILQRVRLNHLLGVVGIAPRIHTRVHPHRAPTFVIQVACHRTDASPRDWRHTAVACVSYMCVVAAPHCAALIPYHCAHNIVSPISRRRSRFSTGGAIHTHNARACGVSGARLYTYHRETAAPEEQHQQPQQQKNVNSCDDSI